jgi:flavin-dependent dehydrogenase
MLDAIIVGGGPAGAAAACTLATAGRSVTLLERETGPRHAVCGEFISAEAARHLTALGLDLTAAGAAPIASVRLISGTAEACSPLPFPASWGLSRRTLDALLLDRAAALGVAVRRGATVRAILPASDTAAPCRVRLADGTAIAARAVFLATGKHDLRGWERPMPSHTADPLIGFKMHFRLCDEAATTLGRTVELHLFDGFYAGLQRVEDGTANLCLLIPASLYRQTGRRWPALLDALGRGAPLFEARLRGATPLWNSPLAVARIPYGFIHRPGGGETRVWRLGDQAAVTPSFTGDGLAIALETGRMAATLFAAGAPAETYHAALTSGPVRRQIRRAELLSAALLSPRLRAPTIRLARHAPVLLRAGARLTRLATAG